MKQVQIAVKPKIPQWNSFKLENTSPSFSCSQHVLPRQRDAFGCS